MHRSSSTEGQTRIEWCKDNDMDFMTLVVRGITIGDQIFTEEEINKSGGVIIINGSTQTVQMSNLIEIGTIFAFDLEQDARAFNDFFKSFTNEPVCIPIYEPNTYISSKKQGRTWHSAFFGKNDESRLNPIVKWLQDNAQSHYVITKKNIYFDGNDDALHYKMVWGGKC